MLSPSSAVIFCCLVYTHEGWICVFILVFAESIHTMSQKMQICPSVLRKACLVGRLKNPKLVLPLQPAFRLTNPAVEEQAQVGSVLISNSL